MLEPRNIVAGLFASVVLADFGVEVVKVERPKPATFIQGADETDSPIFDALSCNKRSIELDLKTDPRREAFFDLANRADIHHQINEL